MTKVLAKNALPEKYNQVLVLSGIYLEQDIVEDFMKCPVHAFSKYLGIKKNSSDENGTALVLRDVKGNFVVAGVVKYHKPENEDQAGNWSYEFTFNEEDIKDTHQYLVSDASFIELFSKVALNYSLALKDPKYITDLVYGFFAALKNLLEDNASPTEEFEVEMEGYFVASSAVEGDEKVYSLVPSGEMKRLIKDDSSLEG